MTLGLSVGKYVKIYTILIECGIIQYVHMCTGYMYTCTAHVPQCYMSMCVYFT